MPEDEDKKDGQEGQEGQEAKLPDKIYDEDSNDITDAVMAKQKEKDDRLESLQKDYNELEKKSLDKEYNFNKLRDLNKRMEKAGDQEKTDLRKEIEDNYSKKEQELIGEMDDMKAEREEERELHRSGNRDRFMKSYAGEDEETRKRIEEEYKALRDPADTAEQIEAKVRRAALLAGVVVKSPGVGRVAGSPSYGYEGGKSQRYTDTAEGAANYESYFGEKPDKETKKEEPKKE